MCCAVQDYARHGVKTRTEVRDCLKSACKLFFRYMSRVISFFSYTLQFYFRPHLLPLHEHFIVLLVCTTVARFLSFFCITILFLSYTLLNIFTFIRVSSHYTHNFQHHYTHNFHNFFREKTCPPLIYTHTMISHTARIKPQLRIYFCEIIKCR